MAAALPWVKPQLCDDNGNPLAGGKIWTYQAGTLIPIASFTDSTGVVPNANPFILDAGGRGDMWLAPGSYKIVLMDANDVVIWTKDKVKPADGGGGGIVDSDYTFEGYSARFAAFFQSVGLQDTLAKILNLQYTAPAISLTSDRAGQIYEKGFMVSGATLTATVTKRSDPIAEVRFYQGATLLDTDTGTIPSGGIETGGYGSFITDNISFTAEVDDDGSTGGPTTVTASTSITFVYPYYHGVGAAALAASAVGALTKTLINSTGTVDKAFTVNGSQRMYFAYPASYGALTSILDVNDFDVFADWTLRTENITGLDGNAVSYRIYEFNNTAVAGTYDFSFRR